MRNSLDIAKTDINRIKTLQKNNGKDLLHIERSVSDLEQEVQRRLKFIEEYEQKKKLEVRDSEI